jgi:hypothetical protein
VTTARLTQFKNFHATPTNPRPRPHREASAAAPMAAPGVLLRRRSAGAADGGLRWSFGLGRAIGGAELDDVAERWTCVKLNVGTL